MFIGPFDVNVCFVSGRNARDPRARITIVSLVPKLRLEMQSPELRSAAVKKSYAPALHPGDRSGASEQAFPRGPWERGDARYAVDLDAVARALK